MPTNCKQETSTLMEMHHADYLLYVTAPTQQAMRNKALKLIGWDSLKSEYRWSHGARLFVINYINDEGSEIVSEATNNESMQSASGEQALFFENTEYQVEIEFVQNLQVKSAELSFPVFFNGKGDAVRRDSYMQRRQMLSFILNFGNEIGQSNIKVDYVLSNGERRFISLHFDVMSVKLDYHKDLKLILQDIEREYSMLAMSFLRKTYHTFNTDMNSKETPDLIWWNIFKSIQEEFCRSAAMVIDRPHNRLKQFKEPQRADKLKRITPQLENELQEHVSEEGHLYNAEMWQLNDDTIENRFVKFALHQLTIKFISLKKRIYKNVESLPRAYAEELSVTENTLLRLEASPFLRRIGRFSGLKGENLTLKQATGYSTIYRNWLLLQNTYNLHDGIRKMELKDIAELYEIWCFIEVKNIVRQLMAKRKDLKIDEISQDIPEGSTNYVSVQPDFILHLNRGERSKVVLRQGDVSLAEIIYNAQLGISENTNKQSGMGDTIGSLTVDQRPDIVLRLTKEDIKKGIDMTYLFDAKYRLESDGAHQTPPDDAINQMHRYRDAIYYSENAYKKDSTMNLNLKREVLGGYILFPGQEPTDPEKENYLQSISKVNIGAFPLRPDKEGVKDRFLREFLNSIINKPRHEVLMESIPHRGLKYIEDKVESPVLLIGYAKLENVDIIMNEKMYYIPAIKDSENVVVQAGFEKAKYLLLHTDKPEEKRWLYELTGKPKFISGKEIKALGFTSSGTDEDIYLKYNIKVALPVIVEGFDVNKVNLGRGKKMFIPTFRTIAEPDVY